MKHFDFCCGNPPYQAEVQNEGDRANPIYDRFMDAAFEIADCVELIHPARFLFNAGQTSKVWNRKMLDDKHFKVLTYEPDASLIFPNTEIKGGVAITLHDSSKDFGAIGTFAKHGELNTILQKIASINTGAFFDSLVSSRGLYRFSQLFYEDYPEAPDLVGSGSGNMIVSNSFDALKHVFGDVPPEDSYISIIGRTGNARRTKYIPRKYVISNEYIDGFKVLLAEANGSGKFGEVLSLPTISKPGEGATDTFISVGPFDTEEEAISALAYIKTKFCRAMLGVNKATQHNPKAVWRAIPLPTFTPTSDIDWSKSIPEIDWQLYKKYGLTKDEIDFIETHVKEMK